MKRSRFRRMIAGFLGLTMALSLIAVPAAASANTKDWYRGFGSWGVVEQEDGNHVMKCQAREQGTWVYTGEESWTDYAVEADITILEGDNGGLMFRAIEPTPDVGDGYHGIYAGFDATTFYLGEIFNGWIAIETKPLETPLGTTRHLRVEVQEKNVQVYLDGSEEPFIDCTPNTSLSAGQVGLHCSTAIMTADNFKVTDLTDGSVLQEDDFENFVDFGDPNEGKPTLEDVEGTLHSGAAWPEDQWILGYGPWMTAWDSDDGAIAVENSTAGNFCAIGSTAWENYTLSGDITLTDGDNAGFFVRGSELSPGRGGGYRGYFIGFSTSTLYLGKVDGIVGPAWTTLEEYPLETVYGQTRNLAVKVQDDTVVVQVDGEEKIHHTLEETDPLLHGCVGVHATNASAEMDNITVTAAGGDQLLNETFAEEIEFYEQSQDDFAYQYDVTYTGEGEPACQVELQLQKYGQALKRIPLEWTGSEIHGNATFTREDLIHPDDASVNLVGYFTVALVGSVEGEEVEITSAEFEVKPRASTYEGTNDFSHIVGTNFTNSSVVSQLQMWLEFDQWKEEIAKELGYARKLGMNSLRIYLHNMPYDQDKETFLRHMDEMLTLCDANGIKPIFIFFDDCWFSGEKAMVFEPIYGDHNGRWANSPFISEKNFENYPKFKDYVQDTITAFREDPRVLAWEIWNEPENGGFGAPTAQLKKFTRDLMSNGFDWAREVDPIQPVISCWSGDALSDINDEHNYGTVGNRVDPIRGTLVTEAGARAYGTEDTSFGSTVEWIDWLEQQRAAGEETPGVYLTWELMVGNSMCRYKWGSVEGTPEPAIPWCGLFYPGGEVVSLAEQHAITKYTTGTGTALLFDGFQDSQITGWRTKTGSWSESRIGNVGDLRSNGSGILVADQEVPNTYTVEASVRLRDVKDHGAGFLVQYDEATDTGYYVGFDADRLYVDKIVAGQRTPVQELVLDGNMSSLLYLPDGKDNVEMHVRNMLRVKVEDGTLSVFLNDPREAILTVTDLEVLPGTSVGFAAWETDAQFDDFAVVEDHATEAYQLTVENGTGSGTYSAGEVVVVEAQPASGETFSHWEAQGLTLTEEQRTAKLLMLTMPEQDVLLKAVMEDTSSGGGSSTVRYAIRAIAGEGGTISPAGTSYVTRGADKRFTIRADHGYQIQDVLIDGASVGAMDEYVFENVRQKHTIEAVFAPATSEGELPFADVAENAWYYDAVSYVYDKGMMDGTSADQFAPDMPLNRAMLVTILYRLSGSDYQGDSNFQDVESGKWYSDAVAWAEHTGLTVGNGDGTFGTMRPITREELAVFLYRYAEAAATDADLAQYGDAEEISPWAEEAMQWAVSNQLIAGDDQGNLMPARQATRAQAAAVLMRFCDK